MIESRSLSLAAERFTKLSLAVLGPDRAGEKIPLYIPADDELDLAIEEPEVFLEEVEAFEEEQSGNEKGGDGG